MNIKRIVGIFLAAFALAGVGVWAYRSFGDNTGNASTPSPSSSARMAVYYFHTTYRCMTCNKLEAYAKEAVEKGFAKEMEKGEVTFASVNVEEKGNEHYIEDYQLKTKSLVLVAPARKDHWKNLEKIWDLVAVKDGYVHYVQEEAKIFLLGVN
jgi:hypothetical protein